MKSSNVLRVTNSSFSAVLMVEGVVRNERHRTTFDFFRGFQLPGGIKFLQSVFKFYVRSISNAMLFVFEQVTKTQITQKWKLLNFITMSHGIFCPLVFRS